MLPDTQGNPLSAVLQSVSSQEDRSGSSPLEADEVLYTQLNDLSLGEDTSDVAGQDLGQCSVKLQTFHTTCMSHSGAMLAT